MTSNSKKCKNIQFAFSWRHSTDEHHHRTLPGILSEVWVRSEKFLQFVAMTIIGLSISLFLSSTQKFTHSPSHTHTNTHTFYLSPTHPLTWFRSLSLFLYISLKHAHVDANALHLIHLVFTLCIFLSLQGCFFLAVSCFSKYRFVDLLQHSLFYFYPISTSKLQLSLPLANFIGNATLLWSFL